MPTLARLLPLFLLILTSCNLYGGLDGPDGDDQLLSAARAALDDGNYNLAREYYQRLSGSFSDQRISELTFTTFAENNIFTMQDLVESLGTGRGSGQSLVLIAQTMAKRGKTDGATRVTTQAEYTNSGSIANPELKSFMRFIISFTLLEETLANAVGADGILTESDLVTNPTTCFAAGSVVCAATAGCDKPNSLMIDHVTGNDVTDVPTATNWNTAASITKIAKAASASANNANALGTSSGILSSIGQLGSLLDGSTAAGARCTRYQLINVLYH